MGFFKLGSNGEKKLFAKLCTLSIQIIMMFFDDLAEKNGSPRRFFSVRFFFQKNLKSPVSADLDRFQGSFMAINHFGVCLEAEKSQKTVKNHLIFMIFPNFEKFSDFFFKNKTKKIIEIYCSELILMVNRFKTVVFMPKTALQILKLLKNR